MALNFTAGSSESVTVTDPFTGTPSLSFAGWWNLSAVGAGARLWGIADKPPQDRVFVNILAANDWQVAWLGAQNLVYTTTNGGLTTGSWIFLAGTISPGAGANDKIHLYRGDLFTAPTEETMSTASEGSGLRTLNGHICYIGSAPTSSTSFGGDVAGISIWSGTVLTLAQIQLIWGVGPLLSPMPDIHFELGFNGISTQPDWSGNGNTGTGTGVVAANHVPRRPFFMTIDGWFSAAVVAALANRMLLLGVGR
jgi:hypothetical protein